jgi:hypothetical protein
MKEINKKTEINNIDINKRSQIQFELSALLIELNSKYGMCGLEPTLERQKEIYQKIKDLREQLKNY